MLVLTLGAALALQSSPTLSFEPTFDPTNLAFADLLRFPTDAVAFPGDDRIFVSVLGAEVRIIRGGELLTERFLDVSAQANVAGFIGLAAITLHPRFDVNGHMYLWYGNRPDPMSAPLDMVLARVTVDAQNPDRADPATLVELLRVPFDTATHSGGRIAFGPDGKLWIGVGDAGLQGDP
ncbi:MAG: PQQ-dependent sugar dehydrogenase, partial [Planctomycetota bacterium]